ncbi:MAG: bis(5'-nucleosyl)-tetraphosphatase (symmetrical) [Bermanella sp.]|jgi:bis(5'-nucleosyl)-tetraphosphatase (symmetrical)
MTRYAVGDIQGCFKPLQCLLEEVSFTPGKDELWLVGDLVNRGAQSLETLECLYPIRDSLRIVLGNHDLHLLALARSATARGRHASLEPLLQSPQLDTFLAWFRSLPLCIRADEGDYVMTHAGIPHIWSTEAALSYSEEISLTLQDDVLVDTFLRDMYGDEPARWSATLSGTSRLRTLTNYFTRMRCCSEDGTLNLAYKGAVDEIPVGMAPWFSWPETQPRSETQLFGHWAALEGKTGRDDCIALDTGCVWGRKLTLLNMDTRDLHQCDCSAKQQ